MEGILYLKNAVANVAHMGTDGTENDDVRPLIPVSAQSLF